MCLGLRPKFAEIFVGCEPLEGLESSGEVVGSEEVGQVRFELVVGVVEVSFHRSVLDGPVHPFDLSIGVRFHERSRTCRRDGRGSVPLAPAGSWQVGELDAVIGEHGMNAIRNSFDQRFKERCCGSHVGLFDQLDHSELRSPVDRDEQVELALGGSYLG